ncbi:MAG: type II secretion system protein GspG [Candidatus Rokubacteria bacterium]|nr:type II secretion system protein GspG [Candidatus Rokubacteria bacterium]
MSHHPFEPGNLPAAPAKKPRSGLPTWVWILLVFVVIGPIGLVTLSIVAAIAIPSLMSARMEANQSRALAETEAIGAAIQSYVAVQGDYPETLDELVRPDESGAQYLNSAGIPSDPWGRPYMYALPGEFASEALVYTLGLDGEPGGELEAADIVYSVPE